MICEAYKAIFYSQLKKKAHQMLIKWQQHVGVEATKGWKSKGY